jgi:B9 domain-containing protein 1
MWRSLKLFKIVEMTFFSVNIQGQLESGLFPDSEKLYCKVSLSHGADWVIINGIEEGITQIATSCRASNGHSDIMQECVWNYPLELVYKSTNVYGDPAANYFVGWPQLIISVYGMDFMGRDVIKGYGCMRLPLTTGRFTKYVPTITPCATSPFSGFLSWLVGRRPEFIDAKFVSKGDGREGIFVG